MYCFGEIYWFYENLFDLERCVDFNEKFICFKGDNVWFLVFLWEIFVILIFI